MYAGKLGKGRVNVYQALNSIQNQSPMIIIHQKSGLEIGGSVNGIIEPNEIIELTISLKNQGFPVNNLSATLSAGASNVTVLNDNNPYLYGDMVYGEVKSNSGSAYRFQVAAPVQTNIPLVLTLSGSNGYSEIINFTVNNSIFWAGEIFKAYDATNNPELPLPMWRVCAHDIPAWGDFNNNGLLDVLFIGTNFQGVGGQVAKLYRNDGMVDGQWKFTEIPFSTHNIVGAHQGSVAWGDFDNDGYLDVLITGINGAQGLQAKIYKNNQGTGSFTPLTSQQFPAPGVRCSQAAWGDFNNDGYLDVLLTGQISNGQRISKIYKNNGDGTFTDIGPTAFPAPGVSYSSVAWGDFNNDGYLDVLLTGQISNSQRISKIYKNNGDGTFTDIGSTAFPAPGVYRGTSTWGDYDNDGYLDILLTGQTSGSLSSRISKVYKNNGDGTFTENTQAGLVASRAIQPRGQLGEIMITMDIWIYF